MPSRNNTVDVAKGIGMLLVVFGHNWIVIHHKGLLFRAIFSFHVPLFLFLSGVYIKESNSFYDFILSKADALLKPYLAILVILGGVVIPFGSMSFVRYFYGVLYGVGASIIWMPLWFLPNLFVSLLFSWSILRLTRNISNRTIWLGLIVMFLLVFGVAYIDYFWVGNVFYFSDQAMLFVKTVHFPGLPFSLDIVFVSSAFVLLGYLFRDEVKAVKLSYFCFSLVFFLFCLLLFFFPVVMDLNFRVYGDFVVSTLRAFFGVYIVIFLSELISRNEVLGKSLAYIGSCSIFVLVFHSAVQAITYSVLSLIYKINYFNGVVSFVLGVVLPIIFFEVTKRQRLLSVILLPKKIHVH